MNAIGVPLVDRPLKIHTTPVDDATSYYRILNPYMELSRRGHDVVIGGLWNSVGNGRGHWVNGSLGLADVWVVQYGAAGPALESLAQAIRLAKARGTKVVFEFDDNYREVSWFAPGATDVTPEARAGWDRMIAQADVVTTTTPDLAARFDLGARGFVCRNTLKPEHWAWRLATDVRPRITKTVRIGWMGGKSHIDDLKLIVRPIMRLLKEYPQIMFVIGSDKDFGSLFPRELRFGTGTGQVRYAGSTSHIRAELPPGVVISSPELLPQLFDRMAIDIAIAPLVDNTFNAGKSWVKLLEYGAAGVPVIASDVGPYAEYNRLYPKAIMLASGPDDFYRALKRLVCNPEHRTRLSARNREYVSTYHVVGSRSHEWEAALQFALSTLPTESMRSNASQ